MAYEINIDDKTTHVELIGQEDTVYKIKVDDKIYTLDLVELENGIYSALLNGYSYNLELAPHNDSKKYTVDTNIGKHEVEVIDAETKYQRSRMQDSLVDEKNVLSSPVPGKVIDVSVTEGMEVTKDQTLVVVSAMKMESELKSSKNGIVKEIKIENGQTVESDQVLVIIE